MSSILFLSEKDPNSVKLYEWAMNTLSKETLKGIEFVSIHKDKAKVSKYRIKKVPTLYKNNLFYIGSDIIPVLEECDPSVFIPDDIFNSKQTTFSASYNNKNDDWAKGDGPIKPIVCEKGSSSGDLSKEMAEYNSDYN